MAFCKHCGTEYPDGGACPNPACPGNQQAAAPTGNPLDGGFNEAMEHVKKNKSVIIGAIAAFIVLVIVIVFLGGHMGAKGAANKYAKNQYKKSGFKAMAKVTMLDDAYKEFKSEDYFDGAKDAHKEYIEDLKDDDTKVKLKSVKKVGKLNNKELKAAKEYFKAQAKKYKVDDDIKIKKGYEYKIKYSVKEDGDKETEKESIWVVKVKGDGWKVMSAYDVDDDYDLDDFDLDDFDF